MPSCEECIGKTVKLSARPRSIIWPHSRQGSGSWTIASFFLDNVLEGEVPEEFELQGTFKAKGVMPTLNNTDKYVLIAHLTNESKYGYTYEVDLMRLDYDLESKEDQRAFLSFILTQHQIDTLFESVPDVFGALANHDTQTLMKARGIGAATAQRLIQRYDDNIDKGIAYVKLQGMDLTKNAIDKLIAHYGSPDVVVDKIEANPYILIEEVPGYGWIKADHIAQSKGVALDSPYRMRAYALEFLRQQAESNGNSWISINDLLAGIDSVCNPKDEQVMFNVVKELMTPQSADEDPFLYYDRETKRVGLMLNRRLEEGIAAELMRLQHSPSSIKINPEVAQEIIERVEDAQGFKYTDEQLQAIWKTLNNQVSILTGLGGTGKTYSVSAITQTLKAHGYRVAQCSLSGRAASKLSEVTHVAGSTIHRLLKYDPETEAFTHDADNPLDYDIIIGDEVSMWGGEITLSLLRAIPSGAKFLMVGDPGQLEAIGLASVLNDCIKSGVIPLSRLTKIQRQQAESGIITQSIRVSHGEQIVSSSTAPVEVRGGLHDFKLITYEDSTLTHDKIMEEYRYLYQTRHISPNDIQVIVPMRSRGEASCRSLNIDIQALVNPETFGPSVTVEYEDGVKYSYTYRVHDRIIITKNIYKTVDLNGQQQPVFNGNVGYIKSINNDHMIVEILEQGSVIIDAEYYQDLSLGYAITVHKKQGDSSPYVIFGIDYSAYSLLSREMLYTGITRARKYCALVGQRTAIMAATKISRVRVKQTWLQELLANYDFLSKNLDKCEEI